MAIDDFIDKRAFVPAVAGDWLTPEQAERYNEDGFLVLRDHLPRDMIDDLLPRAEALAADNHRSQKDIDRKEKAFDALYRSRYVLGTVEHFHGPSTLLQAFLFCKLPGEQRTKHWHQDGVYWNTGDGRIACVFVPLTEANVDNGCIHMIPGSHKLGRIHHWVAHDEFGLENLECDIAALREPVACEVGPGDAIIAHSLTVHASFDNHTDRPRINLGFHCRHVDCALELLDPYRKVRQDRLGHDPASSDAA